MQPTFVLSFDSELMWGSFDRLSVARFQRRYPDLRGTYFAIIELLDEYQIPATWAVVGHLFLDRCQRDEAGRTHPDLVRPRYEWFEGDWLSHDPGTDRLQDPLWYGADIIDRIQGASVRHEIGSHSFSHADFADAGMSREAARADLEACVQAAQARGIELRSFVFPRNREGHLDVIREAGFTAIRGADPNWYQGHPRIAARVAHLADQAVGLAPPVSRPVERLPGLWDIPGSMLLLHRVGMRRWVSTAAKESKAQRGIARAIDEGSVFHLWTHPMNLAHDRAVMMTSLRRIIEHVAERRDRGVLRVATMHTVADESARLAETTVALGNPRSQPSP